jgi:hypothetical protein
MILGGGGFRVPLICRELAASGLAVGEVVLYDVVPERLGAISAVLAADSLRCAPPPTWTRPCAGPT